MPYYIAEVGDGETILPVFYLICFLVILIAAFSSTDLKFVRVLSVSSTLLFLALIAYMWLNAGMGLGEFASSASNLGGYFANIHKFIIPLTDYHEFYLFWWFAWSIMIEAAPTMASASLPMARMPNILSSPSGPTISFTKPIGGNVAWARWFRP
jgi:hypothetical protein